MADDLTDTPVTDAPADSPTARPARRRRAASRPAGPPAAVEPAAEPAAEADATAPAPRKSAAKKSAAKKSTAEKPTAEKSTVKKATAKKATAKKSAAATEEPEADEASATMATAPPRKKATKKRAATAEPASAETGAAAAAAPAVAAGEVAGTAAGVPLFQAPEATPEQAKRRRRRAAAAGDESDLRPGEAPAAGATRAEPARSEPTDGGGDEETAGEAADEGDESGDPTKRRRRRRGGRRRRKGGGDDAVEAGETGDEPGAATGRGVEPGADQAAESEESDEGESGDGTSRRRRRRRRRGGGGGGEVAAPDDPPNTVVKVRAPRQDVSPLKGSTRLEAKKQRRREGREAGRRRAPILTEAEFLARREDVDRRMVVRQVGDRVQIAVLEDGVLVEHYVNNRGSQSLVGNVYLGRVQNVLPSMEAAFVDIGRGRNAVLYAGEVNWDAAGLDGQPKRIEFALKSGDGVLVQVTKDPLGHKGARLTSQISMPGRYLVLVPDGSMTGISRKLPDTERSRLKSILRKVVPDDAGVIVRTAAEGASEEELDRDVSRLAAHWDDIRRKAKTASPPALLYGEPDLAIRVVRDIFNEDFAELIVSGPDVWETVEQYVSYVAPDLAPRLRKWVEKEDVFASYRIDEQLTKALDRKVWLPSGGSLVIDRTEAMTVVDVNTGKFTGQGGNLEETVTRNNLEAAEEIVRQLRLRDIGGIIVVDFIDMVLESNRDLVLRRLVECLARDRTKHQVAEVTSLGLVQMTRKRIGQGLLETFSETCEHCNGRGLRIRTDPVEAPGGGNGNGKGAEGGDGGRKSRRGKRAADPADVMAATLSRPAEEPVAEEPVAEEPVVEEPVVEEPVAEEPVAEEPVAEEPVAEEMEGVAAT